MTQKYPRIRVHTRHGVLVVREILKITFFMRHSHATLASRIHRALEAYLRVVGTEKLALYAEHQSGEWQALDSKGWSLVREELRHPTAANIHLAGTENEHQSYQFSYEGKQLEKPAFGAGPGEVSAVSFNLPTECLEEQGPERIRALGVELASSLPFCFGHVSLALSSHTVVSGGRRDIFEIPFRLRYPGMGLFNVGWDAMHIGTHVMASSWMTFLGNPVLAELGGVAGLRAQLHSPQTTVEELDGHRAVVTLGPEPEAGDTEQGEFLPAYRELARVLEPWLYHEPQLHLTADMEPIRRWERRFLD